ncbi:hypothetical protein M0R04_13315 [Candidatus Dojkabacteria bacterium]|jgi:hypothetical protein|nr:hypothetical protein [Candidatus Dojkabacteria bacterium]
MTDFQEKVKKIMKDNIVTIDLGKLDKEKPTGLILAKDGSLALEAENELKKILDTQALLEKIIDYVKERLGEEMEKKKLIKVKGDSFTISKRYFGTRYSLSSEATDDFINTVTYNKPNIEAIDDYLAKNQELPSGIVLRDREQKISLIRREEDV